MNVIRHTDQGFGDKLRALTTHSILFDPTIEERTRAIVRDVCSRGDAALLELTERFDGAVTLTTFRVAPESGPVATLLLEQLLQQAGSADRRTAKREGAAPQLVRARPR